MLINTVILMLRDALPIALLMSFLLLAFRTETRTLWLLLITSGVTTAILVLTRNSISNVFDGSGYEWLTIGLLFTAYLAALFSVQLTQQTPSILIAATPIISLHLADFMVYLVAFGSHSERIPAIFIGSVLGSGISLSLAILLVVLLAPYRTSLVMRSIWMLFIAAQASDITPLLQQIGAVEEYTPLWDSSALVADASEYGHLFNALFGYEAQPGLPYLITWALLVLVAQWVVLRRYFLLRRHNAEGVVL